MGMKTGWTIGELADAAALALRSLGLDQGSPGRGRAVPDVRTIRYYATSGLLARPLSYDGRSALYGRHHLEQLVAIKRLQASGASLEVIQQHLGGLDAAGVSALAGLGETPMAPAPPPVAVGEVQAARGAALGRGVTLLLGPGRALTAEQLVTIGAAAAPLMARLDDLGLLTPAQATTTRAVS